MPSLADKYLQTFLLPVSVGVLASVTAALIISALIFLQTGTVRLRNSWSTMLAAVALTLPGYAVGALIHAGLCVVYALYAVRLIVPSQTAFIRTLWQGAELAVLVWIGFVTIQILRGVRSRRERFSLFVVAPAAALVVTMPVVVLWMTT